MTVPFRRKALGPLAVFAGLAFACSRPPPVSQFPTARAAIDRDVGRPLGLDTIEAAWGIARVVHATMSDAVRRVLATKGADPRELALVAYGGGGPVHAWAQAVELGIGHVLIPRTAPGFSAPADI